MSDFIARALFEFVGGVAESLVPPGSMQLDYWTQRVPEFNYSAQEFYQIVRKNLDECEIPQIKIEIMSLKEAGLFSARRLYLRLRRERLWCFICAAPFGSGFFFSYRLIDKRRDANPLHYILAVGFLVGVFGSVGQEYGWPMAVVVGWFLFALTWSCMRLAATSALEWFEERIIATPVLGRLYCSWFIPETFYRQDLKEVFKKAISKTVVDSIEQVTSLQGVRSSAEAVLQPAVRDLHLK